MMYAAFARESVHFLYPRINNSLRTVAAGILLSHNW